MKQNQFSNNHSHPIPESPMLNACLLIIPTGQQLLHGMPHLPLIPISQTFLLPHGVFLDFSTEILLVVLFQLP